MYNIISELLRLTLSLPQPMYLKDPCPLAFNWAQSEYIREIEKEGPASM